MSKDFTQDIPGFDKYYVTRNGNVFNLITGRKLKNSIQFNSQKKNLSSRVKPIDNQGVQRTLHVNRLVASAFIRELNDKLIVLNVDKNPDNNHVSNLQVLKKGHVLTYRKATDIEEV